MSGKQDQETAPMEVKTAFQCPDCGAPASIVKADFGHFYFAICHQTFEKCGYRSSFQINITSVITEMIDRRDKSTATPTPTITVTRGEITDNHHLKLARQQMEEYEHRINNSGLNSHAPSERQFYEDRAYKRAMMHAAYAQAEAATRQAEVMEDFLEFFADVVGRTDLIDALLQWGYRQKTG